MEMDKSGNKNLYRDCENVMVFFDVKIKGDAAARKYSSEAALSLRSRRSGTKFATPYGAAH